MLTVNPGYCNTFKECNPEKTNTAGRVIVEQLKDVHATLRETQRDVKVQKLHSDIETRSFLGLSL